MSFEKTLQDKAMLTNIVITKQGSEADDSSRKLFSVPELWEDGGSNLIIFLNGKIITNGVDYSVTDNNTVQLTVAAKTSDSLQFVITRLADSSPLSYNEQMSRLDSTAKKIEGKAQTSASKRINEETIPSKINIHANDIWSNPIDPNPTKAAAEGVVKIREVALTEDSTVANKMAWIAKDGDTIIGDWVPPRYGRAYFSRLFDSNGIEIPSSDSSGWSFDYESGVLKFSNAHSFSTPFKLSGYTYLGKKGSSLSRWLDPVFAQIDFPLYGNEEGDVRLVLTEDKLYRYDMSAKKWMPFQYGSEHFKSPVAKRTDLPASAESGDLILVIEENNLYTWINTGWEILTGRAFQASSYWNKDDIEALLLKKSDVGHTHDTLYYRKEQIHQILQWRASRANVTDLPPYTENKDGDVILTRDTNTLYRWYTTDPNVGTGHWEPIFHANFSWKEPVLSVAVLPVIGNALGDTRLVSSESKLYFWDGAGWHPLLSEAAPHDHDDRYVLKSNLSWKPPVVRFIDLPTGSLGDVCLVEAENTLYWYTGTVWENLIKVSQWKKSVPLLSNLVAGSKDDLIFVEETKQVYFFDGTVWEPLENKPHDHDLLYYKKAEVDALIVAHDHDGINSPKISYNNLKDLPVFTWKNPVERFSDLPLNPARGDAYIVFADQKVYYWDGVWKSLTPEAGINGYSKAEVDSIISSLTVSISAQLSQKSDIAHEHDSSYYTRPEMDQLLAEKAQLNHTHNYADKVHDHDDRYYTKSQLSSQNSASVDWTNITNKPTNDAWQTPVQQMSDLPYAGNTVGDIRLVLSSSEIYRWDGLHWNYVGVWASPQISYWKDPVLAYSDLPFLDNTQGDIRLVEAENVLYRWDSVAIKWVPLLGGGSGGSTPSTGMSTQDIQVYLNGQYLVKTDDWIEENGSIRILRTLTDQDHVTILILGAATFRFNFTGDQNPFYIDIPKTYYKKELVVSAISDTFTIPVAYSMGTNSLLIWLNGLLQRVNLDYDELSTTQFRFRAPLQVGDHLSIIVVGTLDGTNSYIREDYLVDNVDTHLFSLINSYLPNSQQVLVFLNGQLLTVRDDYLEIDTHTVELPQQLQVDDLVSFVILKNNAGSGSIIQSANELLLGYPTDKSWLDGYHPFTYDMTVADAIDEINETLLEFIPHNITTIDGRDLVSDLEMVSGFIADGNVYVEGVVGEFRDYLTMNGNFTVKTPADSFINADLGIIKAFINNVEVDSFDLGKAFVEANRTGTQSAASYGIKSQGAGDNVGIAGSDGSLRISTNGVISVQGISKLGFRRVQKGEVYLLIKPSLLRHGYNTIQLKQFIALNIYQTHIFKFFYDGSAAKPNFTGTNTIIQKSLISQKYLSGVRYYSTGDSFATMFNVINAFYSTYVAEPVLLDMEGLEAEPVEYSDYRITNVSDIPHKDEIISFSGNITLNELSQYSIDARLTVATKNPFEAGQTFVSNSENRLVNTYSSYSTNLVEPFLDEVYRLPVGEYNQILLSRMNQWNSKLQLTSADALVFDRGVRYANMSFSDYLPTQPADYSLFSGSQSYTRSFYKMSPNNGGYFILDGISQSDLTQNRILIDVKLPTQTGWLSLNKNYTVHDFTGVDGDGCLIDVVDNKFYYSSGVFSTVFSGYSLIFRVTLPNATAPVIKRIELVWN
jgi:hypothetical protein